MYGRVLRVRAEPLADRWAASLSSSPRKLRDDRKISRTPVIVLTADGRAETADLAFYESATDFVTKPVDPVELVARVRELADGRAQSV